MKPILLTIACIIGASVACAQLGKQNNMLGVAVLLAMFAATVVFIVDDLIIDARDVNPGD